MALGKMTVFDGDPGLGKSTALLDVAARITTGAPLPGEVSPRLPRGVVLLSAEDGLADTIVPRLLACGAQMSRIYAMTGVLRGTTDMGVTIPDCLPDIAAALVRMEASLLVIDPLMAYFSSSVNANNDQQVRTALKPLATMLEQTHVACAMIRHMNKADTKQALYRGGGSIGIIGAARFGMMVARDPDDEESRVLATTKCNLAVEPPSLKYRLESVPGTDVARVAWYGESSPYSAQQLLDAKTDEDDDGEEVDAWLRHLIPEQGVTRAYVTKEARKSGYSERQIRRAVKRLRISSKPSDFGGEWVMHLPTQSLTVRTRL
jgi:hypothetical protein